MSEPKAEYRLVCDSSRLEALAGRRVERVCLLQSGAGDIPANSRLLLFLDNGCCFEFLCRGHLLPLAGHQGRDIHSLLQAGGASYVLDDIAAANPDSLS